VQQRDPRWLWDCKLLESVVNKNSVVENHNDKEAKMSGAVIFG